MGIIVAVLGFAVIALGTFRTYRRRQQVRARYNQQQARHYARRVVYDVRRRSV